MYKQKKFFCFITTILVLMTQVGCNINFIGRTEIKRIEFIRAVGVDKSPNNDKQVRLTIATQSMKASGGSGQQKESEILFAEGDTVFDAVRSFWGHMDKRPFWGHLEYVIIGEEAAREGLYKYIDFFSRDPEVRLNLKVFIVHGGNAQEIIKQVNVQDKFIFDRLEGVIENQWGQSISVPVKLIEVMYILDNEYLSLYLPCIRLGTYTEYENEKTEKKDLVLGGFGIFKGDKLADYIDDEMGRGLNWLRNAINSGVIVVKSPKANNISLEIIDSKTKFYPQIVNGKLKVNIKVKASSNIAEISSTENIFTGEVIEYLEKQQAQLIKEEIESVIKYGQKEGLEFFGTLYAVQHKYPIKWEEFYSKSWMEIYPDIKYSVVVESKINRTYNIREPRFNEAGGGE